jgi:hypothetical protein
VLVDTGAELEELVEGGGDGDVDGAVLGVVVEAEDATAGCAVEAALPALQ